MGEASASVSRERARTLDAAVGAWLGHLAAAGSKLSSVRAYSAAMRTWFLPTLATRACRSASTPTW
jgi:hypothetical protein